MPLRQLKTQNVGVCGDLGDGFARHDDRADGYGDGQHPALRRRQHCAFLDLLGDHGSLRLGRLQRIRRDLQSGARFIELGARCKAALRKLLLPLRLGFRGFGPRAQADDLRIEHLHSQSQLVVRNGREHIAGFHFASALYGERCDSATRADARVDLVGAADGCEDSLQVVNGAFLDLEHILCRSRCAYRYHGQHQQHGARCRWRSYRGLA